MNLALLLPTWIGQRKWIDLVTRHQQARIRHSDIIVLVYTAVKPLEYQVEYRALEQSLNITM